MSAFKDAGHLFRFAGLFVLAFLVFLVVRHYVVPKNLGSMGIIAGPRWRDCGASGEVCRVTRPARAATQTCAGREVKGQAAHVNCEACHGALANHADDPRRSSRFCRIRRCFAHDATRRAPPSRRDFRRLYRRITRMEFRARLATIHTVRRWMQEVRSEYYPGVKC